MRSPTLKTAALASVVALLGSLSAPLSTAQVGTEALGFDPAAILPPPAPQAGELLAFDMNRIVTTQTQLIRYEATEYQRKVAEERARAFVAAQRRAIAKQPSAAPSKPGPKKTPEPPEKPGKPKSPEPGTAAKPKELPRYIAVDTVKDKRASPKAKKVVMIWDTHAEALVGNNVYDVENPPAVGATTNFETYSAQYIGAGL
jgi:hypothetical protein